MSYTIPKIKVGGPAEEALIPPPRPVASPMARTPVRETEPPTNRSRFSNGRHEFKNLDDWQGDEEGEDRLRIPLEKLPDDFDYQWVTNTIFGQPMTQHRARFERNGWEAVHNDDFDGAIDGMFCRHGSSEEVLVDAAVLMCRPLVWSMRAKQMEFKRARERIEIKQRQLGLGDLSDKINSGKGMDSRHKSALAVNRIQKHAPERIRRPEGFGSIED